ncbi:MAG: hypothetical protein R3F11_27590 [Verrucomicrobiales bacterium]
MTTRQPDFIEFCGGTAGDSGASRLSPSVGFAGILDTGSGPEDLRDVQPPSTSPPTNTGSSRRWAAPWWLVLREMRSSMLDDRLAMAPPP